MQISDILRYKEHSGTDAVWTIAPDATITDLLGQLAEHHIGAMVVTDADALVGMVSERDIVRRLTIEGPAVLEGTVREMMTADVVAASPNDAIDRVATLMTERRIRHLPVLQDDRIVGVVSIGDVVYSRIRELEQDRTQLEHYITG